MRAETGPRTNTLPGRKGVTRVYGADTQPELWISAAGESCNIVGSGMIMKLNVESP